MCVEDATVKVKVECLQEYSVMEVVHRVQNIFFISRARGIVHFI